MKNLLSFKLYLLNSLIVISTLLPMSVFAECESVLIPSTESFKTDYKLLYAYAKVNSSELYDEIEKAEARSRGASGNYGVIGAEFTESKSKEEFRTRVENILQIEKFTMQVDDAKAYYRNGLSEDQIKAWGVCMQGKSNGGYLLLNSKYVGKDGFLLQVEWSPQVGAGRETLSLSVTNGTINNKNRFSEKITKGSKTYQVKVSEIGEFRVFANIKGLTDAVLVSNKPKRAMQLVKKEKLCNENDDCRRSKVIACLPSSEHPKEVPDSGQPLGRWVIGPEHKDFDTTTGYKTTLISYGKWENQQCIKDGKGIEGTGWHAEIGSCEKGGGSKLQRCNQVKVEYDTYE